MGSGSGEREDTSLRVIEVDEEDMFVDEGVCWGLKRGLSLDGDFFYR